MAIQFKCDVLASLREAGFSSYRLRKESLVNQTAIQRLRDGKLISWEQLATICQLLNCQPGDLLEFVEGDNADRIQQNCR